MIDDARARQRRHRALNAALVAALVAGVVIAGIANGGGGGRGTGYRIGGRPSGPGAGGSHSSASKTFPGAPLTQPDGYGVQTDACPLAPPSRYLPRRSGCLTVLRRADVSGEDRSDLILVYSRLSDRRPDWFAAGTPASLGHDFVPEAAFLETVLADGTSVTTRLPRSTAASITSVARVDEDGGDEIFLQVAASSSGATELAYGLEDGRWVSAGVALSYGGDSASRAGFDCLPGNPPRLIARTYELIGPTIYGRWRQTDITYAWRGRRLVQSAKRIFTRRGEAPPASQLGVGRGCATRVAS